MFFKFHFLILSFLVLNKLFNSNIFSQDIPSEFLSHALYDMQLDVGYGWSANALGPLTWQDIEIKNVSSKDSLLINNRFGLGIFKSKNLILFNPYLYTRLVINKTFYTYLFSRAVSDNDNFNIKGYSADRLERKRFGLTSAENDLAGFGFKNDWLKLQYGRGREVLGKNNKINLVLSENSPSLDYGLIGFQYKRFQARYFHGFLENHNGVNRYINGRSLNYNNDSNFMISLSEIIIYSGLNRPIDFAYLNPIASHLEIEFNNRQNTPNTGSGNAVWLVSSDYLYNSAIRITGNLLIDELILDQEQKKIGKNNGFGYSFRLSRAWNLKKYFYGISAHYLNIGSKVFKHENGYNNFSSRGKPLGWKYGSNGLEYGLSMHYLSLQNVMIQLNYGKRIVGDQTILLNPYLSYDNYNSLNKIENPIYDSNYLDISINYWVDTNLKSQINVEVLSNIDSELELKLLIGLDMYFLKKTKAKLY